MTRTMRRIKTIAMGTVAVLALALPAGASAANESLEASFSLEPRSGKFLKNGFKPANWRAEGAVSVPAGEPEILPSKVIDIGNPQGEVRFNPGNMPVCGDEIGPGNVSVPVDDVVARCPNSILGNGTAKFAFNRVPTVLLDGVMVAFNGGLNNNGRPLVKVYAYSYDTDVGIFTEAALTGAGRLKFKIPQLAADSAVTTLNLALPGKRRVLQGVDPSGQEVILPKGQKGDYVQAKCSTGQWPWDSRFTHGTRDADDTPTSPDTFTNDEGTARCEGVTGRAKIQEPKVNGKNRIKRGENATYKVKIKNSGAVAAKGVKLKVSGKGVNFNTSVGKIGAGKTRTVKVKARFRKKGNVNTEFRASSNNGGSNTANRKIKVR